jgi:hypothetical protein
MKLNTLFLCQSLSVALAFVSVANSQGQDKVNVSQQSLNASSMLLLKVDTDQLAIPEKIKQMKLPHLLEREKKKRPQKQMIEQQRKQPEQKKKP